MTAIRLQNLKMSSHGILSIGALALLALTVTQEGVVAVPRTEVYAKLIGI